MKIQLVSVQLTVLPHVGNGEFCTVILIKVMSYGTVMGHIKLIC